MANRIAFFVGQISQDFQSQLISSIAENIVQYKYEMDVFCDFGGFGENFLHAEGEKNIIHLPNLENYEGIIIASDTFDVKGMYDELAELVMQTAKCPVVTLRVADERFYNVLIDDYGAIKEMVEHFIKVHGFKKIAFMTGKLDMSDAQRRLQAYQDTMEQYGLPVTEHMVFEGDYWRYKGEEAVEWFFSGEEKPEAIVCANDYMAISVVSALEKRGLKVPGDVSVSGFDLVDEAKFADPPLTSVAISGGEMGKLAVEIIHKIRMGYACERYNYVPVEGVYGGTCGCESKIKVQGLAELYARNQSLSSALRRLSYLNVDFESCDTLEELLHVAFVSSYDFSYDTMYLCMCDVFNKQEEELEASQQYTDKIYLKAIMSRDLGLTMCAEAFDRQEILPAKYREENEVLLAFPLHYKNHCLGYIAMQSNDSTKNLTHIFPTFALSLGSHMDRIYLYLQNKELMGFRMQSLLDELTGMNNRRMLEKELKKRSQNAYAQHTSFCVVNIDMDGLKVINDTFGHKEGDAALKALADVLKSVQREGVIAARVGGDEFSICMDATEETEVKNLIADIYDRIKQYNDHNDGAHPFILSASVGYAFYQRSKDLSDCLERADQQMYADKMSKKKSGQYEKMILAQKRAGGEVILEETAQTKEEKKMLPSDPVMLLSFVNTRLRDQYKSLADLCDDIEGADMEKIIKTLEGIDCHYSEEINQFV